MSNGHTPKNPTDKDHKGKAADGAKTIKEPKKQGGKPLSKS